MTKTRLDDYKGQQIFLLENGKFEAHVSGQVLTATSLAAIRKKVDAAVVVPVIEAVDRYHGWVVKIVGKRQSKSRWKSYQAVLETGDTADFHALGISDKATHSELIEVQAMQKEEYDRHKEAAAEFLRQEEAIRKRMITLSEALYDKMVAEKGAATDVDDTNG